MVARVIPNLREGNIHSFRCVAVGDGYRGRAIVRGCLVLGVVAGRDARFHHSIYIFGIGCPVFVFRQIGEDGLPLVAFVKRDRIARGVAVNVKLHENAGRTRPVDVLLVIPELVDGNRDNVLSVDKRGQIHCCVNFGPNRIKRNLASVQKELGQDAFCQLCVIFRRTDFDRQRVFCLIVNNLRVTRVGYDFLDFEPVGELVVLTFAQVVVVWIRAGVIELRIFDEATSIPIFRTIFLGLFQDDGIENDQSACIVGFGLRHVRNRGGLLLIPVSL